MEERLVTFGIGILAKEVGFNWPTRNHWLYEGDPNINLSRTPEDWNTDCDDVGIISAPTQALLQRWLREVHNIILLPVLADYETIRYCCFIYGKDNTLIRTSAEDISTDTYEEALEIGLQEALILLTKQNHVKRSEENS